METWYSILESELPSSVFKEVVDDNGECNTRNFVTTYVKLFLKYIQNGAINAKIFETATKHFLKNVLPVSLQLQALQLILAELQGKKTGTRCKGVDLLVNVYIPSLLCHDSRDSARDVRGHSVDSSAGFWKNNDLSMSILDILTLASDWCNPDLHKEGKDITNLSEDCIENFKSQAVSCLQFLRLLLFRLNESLRTSPELRDVQVAYMYSLKKAAVKLYIASISNTGSHAWTNNTSMGHARDLQLQICKSLQCPSVSVLLTGTQTPLSSDCTTSVPKGIITDVLKIFRENFTSKNWRQHPGLKHVLIYTITQVKYPFLGKEIPVLVPALLNLCDDFLMENRVLGVSTLSYVIANVNGSDLKLYNHADVIYDSLFKHLYNSGNPVLEVLLPCLLQVVLVMETKLAEIKTLNYRKIDYVMQQILSLLELESKLVNRRTLLRNLKGYVDTLGITVLRHMKRLMTVLFDSLKYYDGKEEQSRILALELLEYVIDKAGSLLGNHATNIAKNVISLLISINSSAESTLRTDKVKESLHYHCGVILKGLCANCGPDFAENLSSLQTADVCGDCEEVKDWIKKTLSQAPCR